MQELIVTLQEIKSKNSNFDFKENFDFFELYYMGKAFRFDFPKKAVESLHERLKAALLSDSITNDLLDFLFAWSNVSYPLWYLRSDSPFLIVLKEDKYYLYNREKRIKELNNIVDFDNVFKEHVL